MTSTPTVILTGPTATGKTDLSIELARHWNTPVISADSRQCYKYLDIGTGKVSESIRADIPHYHISSLYPDQPFTAADFSRKVHEWQHRIKAQGKPVLIVGGSTLYLESLIRPLDPLPPKNEANILELQKLAERSGLKALHKKLCEVDPVYVRRIDGLNPHRMFRALDVWMQTGKPFSSYHKKRDFSLPEDTLLLCLYRQRNELHERISLRVDHMIEEGLLQEVRNILDMGYDPSLQSLQTVGYREPIAFLKGEGTAGQMRENIKRNTRRYARRQLTWFRRWKEAHWFNQSDYSEKKLRDHLILMIKQLAADA